MKVAKLAEVKPKKVDDIESLFGLLADSGELDPKSVKAERLADKCENLVGISSAERQRAEYVVTHNAKDFQ